MRDTGRILSSYRLWWCYGRSKTYIDSHGNIQPLLECLLQYSGYMREMGGNVIIRCKRHRHHDGFDTLDPDALPGKGVIQWYGMHPYPMNHGELVQMPDDVFGDDLWPKQNMPVRRIAELPIGVIYGIISH
jgi:hypothetical protein